jgi:hypothetical protein
MNAICKWALAAPALVLSLAASASPQVSLNKAAIRAGWKPVVGSGAAYAFEHTQMGKMEMEIAVVGTESVGGKTGYWVEMIVKDPRYGEGRTKMLYVGDRDTLEVKRVLVQGPNGPVTEVPMEGSSAGEEQQEDIESLGTETITTPAGTFTCQHYRRRPKKSDSRKAEQAAEAEEGEEAVQTGEKENVEDFWISEKVTPVGLVKMVSRDSTQVLVRLITNAQPRIKETPQKSESKGAKQ